MNIEFVKPEITVSADAQLAARAIFTQGPFKQVSFGKQSQFTQRATEAIQELADADLITVLRYKSGVTCFVGKKRLRYMFEHFFKSTQPFPLLEGSAS